MLIGTSTGQKVNSMANLHWLANPGRFLRIAKAVSPVLAGLTVVLLAVGLALSLQAPVDAVQGTPSKVLFMLVFKDSTVAP